MLMYICSRMCIYKTYSPKSMFLTFFQTPLNHPKKNILVHLSLIDEKPLKNQVQCQFFHVSNIFHTTPQIGRAHV